MFGRSGPGDGNSFKPMIGIEEGREGQVLCGARVQPTLRRSEKIEIEIGRR